MKSEPADNPSRKCARRESEMSRLAVDVEAMTLLYEIGNQCVDTTRGFKQCLEAILDAAIQTLRAQKGNIQLLDSDHGVLKIVVHRGFQQPFLRFFAKVSTDDPACCLAALSSGRRVIVEDIASSPLFARQPALDILVKEGIHALQSTPLISSAGHVIGMISTHFKQRPLIGEREERFLDLLARQAADYVERKRAEKAVRNNEAQLEADRAALIRMHALSARRIETTGVQPLLQEVVDTAVAIGNADKGTLRLLESGTLKLVAHHGHSKAFLDYFAAAANVASVSGEATRRGERILVEDVEQSPLFAGTKSLAVLRRAGVRAIQSTPLITRTGRPLGTLTTQWSRPHLPDKNDLWRLDLLARQATDLIESAQAEEALRKSEQHFRAFVMATSDVVFAMSPDWSEMRHLEGGNFIPDTRNPTQSWLDKYIHPDDQPRVTARIDEAICARNIFELEHRVIRVDGTFGWTFSRAIPLTNEKGDIVEWFGAARDVTKRRQAEEALRLAHAELADRALHLEKLVHERTTKLREMINELEHVSYAIVHDMRAPLRAMNAFADLVLTEVSSIPGIPSHVPDYCQRIINAASRLDKLIQDSLNYTKAVLQQDAFHLVDLSRLIPGLIESYPNLQSDKADISIEGQLPIVLGEESLLTQCFSNLLGNAVKFVPAGVRPQVRLRSERADGFVRISIEDNGIGIPKEAQTRIFGMFERLTHEYEGTGIGLAIVRKVVQRMGGKLGVESEPGKGSRFWVELRTPPAEKPAQSQTAI